MLRKMRKWKMNRKQVKNEGEYTPWIHLKDVHDKTRVYEYKLEGCMVGLSDLVYGFYYYITEFLVRGKLHFTFYFSHIILPELIYTLVISVVVFRVLNRLEKYLSTERREEV